MENKITVFENEEFGNIRTVQDGDNTLFCGFDVAKALGYAIPSKAVNTHCKGVSKMEVPTKGGVQRLLFIRECDVYRLIVHSKLPAAETFEHWIYEDVLPTIRRHGVYITDPLLRKMADNPGLLDKICETMIAERSRADRLDARIALIQPKADYFYAFVNPANCTNIRNTAKELGISERMFCKFLCEAGFLYRCPAGNLMPYSKRSNAGLFIVRDYYRGGHFGAYTLITPAGKDLFRRLLCQAEM